MTVDNECGHVTFDLKFVGNAFDNDLTNESVVNDSWDKNSGGRKIPCKIPSKEIKKKTEKKIHNKYKQGEKVL